MNLKKTTILSSAIAANLLCGPYIVKAMGNEGLASEVDPIESVESQQENVDKQIENIENELPEIPQEVMETEKEPEALPKDNKEKEKSKETKDVKPEQVSKTLSVEKAEDQELDTNQKEENKEIGTASVKTASVKTMNSNLLQKGVSDDRVVELKKNLAKVGFPVPGKGTRLFGADTEAVVKRFQQYYGVNDTPGVAGNATIAKLQEILSSHLQKGKRDARTITLKKNLKSLGFPVPGNTTNYYGHGTEQKVKEFQQKNGLVVNGIADSVTLKKIDENLKLLEPAKLQKGVSDDRVVELKKNLAKIGFPVPGKGTRYYGEDTEATVKKFQQYYGVNDTAGVAGDGTLAKIQEILSSPLQKGKRDARTITLKRNLKSLGFPVPGNTTDYYGEGTEKKVREFQQKHGLVVNGIADSITLQKIEDLLNAPLSKGMRRDDVKTLKINLGKLGFPVPGKTTTLFGKETEKQVKAFQSHFKLIVNGKADNATLEKINQVLSSPLQEGKRHKDVVKLKADLEKLGFKVPGNGTNFYGTETAKKVSEFQKAHGLPVTGIADEITLAKIAEKVKDLPENKEETTYTKYGVTMEQALATQMKQLQQTDKYRNEAAFIHSDYIDITQHGKIYSTGSVNLRTAPNFEDNIETKVSNGTKITILDEVTGDLHAGSTKWYKISFDKKTLYVHSSLVNSITLTGKATSNINVRAGANNTSHVYGTLSKGKEVTIVKENGKWLEIKYDAWRNPTREDVQQYINPNNNDKFQHLLLSASVGASAKQLNNVLAGKGKLAGLGQAFIDGGKKHSVNEIYLISHAFLETGHGTSILADGTLKVGKISDNKYVSIQPKGTYIVEYNPTQKTWSIKKDTNNESEGIEVKAIYNMFGIGAVDSNPNTLGSIRAYQEGWFTPESAIIGGAKFIGERYIHNTYKQNTLYKMRWNPANPGYPQYATDIAWAVKQVNQIKTMYGMLDNPILRFDIAQYK